MNATARGHQDRDWFAHAACVGKHQLFFAAERETPLERTRREHRAKAVCATCPVMHDCRDWAREHREPGVWGGETELERAASGFAPREPGMHIRRDLRRQAEQRITSSLALGDLSDDQIEAIHRLIEGDPTCS